MKWKSWALIGSFVVDRTNVFYPCHGIDRCHTVFNAMSKSSGSAVRGLVFFEICCCLCSVSVCCYIIRRCLCPRGHRQRTLFDSTRVVKQTSSTRFLLNFSFQNMWLICEHNRIRSTCKECGGTIICEHNHERRRCNQCVARIRHLWPQQPQKKKLQGLKSD